MPSYDMIISYHGYEYFVDSGIQIFVYRITLGMTNTHIFCQGYLKQYGLHLAQFHE